MNAARPVFAVMTSSAPFSMSEIWFQAEVGVMESECETFLLPVWPRGDRVEWPGRLLRPNGKPSLQLTRVISTIMRSRELRSMIVSCRDAYNARTSFKMLVAIVVGVRWGLMFQESRTRVCHVHATTVGAPSAGAAAFSHVAKCGASATAHRNDINRRAPVAILERLDLVRAISLRAQDKLARDGVRSHVLRFGGLSFVDSPNKRSNSNSMRGISIGHLRPRKGQMRLLGMVDAARKQGVDLTLDIFGEGPLKEDLANRIQQLGLSEVVTLRGSIPHGDLLTEMRSGTYDLLIHTAVQSGEDDEGIPVAILEAAACGIPIIATASGATGEFVIDNVSGLLIEATDDLRCIQEGTESIIRLASDFSLVETVTDGASKAAVAYRADVTVAAMREALSQVGVTTS